jgi:hypothetical protein
MFTCDETSVRIQAPGTWPRPVDGLAYNSPLNGSSKQVSYPRTMSTQRDAAEKQLFFRMVSLPLEIRCTRIGGCVRDIADPITAYCLTFTFEA